MLFEIPKLLQTIPTMENVMHKNPKIDIDKKLAVFVTGGSGFIGKKLIKLLISNDFKVRVLTRKPELFEANINLELVKGSFSNLRQWEHKMEGTVAVINLAGEYQNPRLMNHMNFTEPLELLKRCKKYGVTKWIQLSSVGAYGSVLNGVVTESWPDQPKGNYEQSKAKFDKVLLNYIEKKEMDVTILRPSIVYGDGMKNQSLRQLIRIVKRGIFAFVGPMDATANYVHVCDVAEALLLALRHPAAAGQTFIVSNCGTMLELIEAISRGVNVGVPSARINPKLVKFIVFFFPASSRFPSFFEALRSF